MPNLNNQRGLLKLVNKLSRPRRPSVRRAPARGMLGCRRARASVLGAVASLWASAFPAREVKAATAD